MNRPRQYLGDKRTDRLLEKVESCTLRDWILIRERIKRRERHELAAWLAWRRSSKTREPVTWLLDLTLDVAGIVDYYASFGRYFSRHARPPGNLNGPAGPRGCD